MKCLFQTIKPAILYYDYSLKLTVKTSHALKNLLFKYNMFHFRAWPRQVIQKGTYIECILQEIIRIVV